MTAIVISLIAIMAIACTVVVIAAAMAGGREDDFIDSLDP